MNWKTLIFVIKISFARYVYFKRLCYCRLFKPELLLPQLETLITCVVKVV